MRLFASAVALVASECVELGAACGATARLIEGHGDCLVSQANSEDGAVSMLLQVDAQILKSGATEAAAVTQLHTPTMLQTSDEGGRIEYFSLLDQHSSDRWAVLDKKFYRRGGALPTLAFVAMTVALACVPFPCLTPFNLAASALFGLWPGTFIFVGSEAVGCIVSALLSRSLLRPCVTRCMQGHESYAETINAALDKEGPVFMVALLRLSPVMPFGLSSYILGFTNVSLSALLLGTVVGVFPFTLVYCYLGKMGADAASGKVSGVQLGMGIASALFTIVLVWKIGRIAHAALDAATQDESEEEKHTGTVSSDDTHGHADGAGQIAGGD